MATYEELIKLLQQKNSSSNGFTARIKTAETFFQTLKALIILLLYVGFLNIIHPERLHIIRGARGSLSARSFSTGQTRYRSAIQKLGMSAI